jgi:hypothetical protein
MSDAEVEAKFRSLANPYITDAKIEQILSTLWKLEQLTDLCSLPGMFAVDKS